MMILKNQRPSWDEYFLAGVAWASLRGDCTRSQVGALLVDVYTHRILSHGYNGTDAGRPGCLEGYCPRGQLSYDQHPPGGSYDNCIARHAEINCLMYAIEYFPDYNYSNGVMYVSRKPCDDCEHILRTAGVGRSVWPEGYIDLLPPKMA